MFVIDAVDSKAESEGLWFDFAGSQFKISSTSNPEYQKYVTKLQLPHRKKIAQGKLEPEIGVELIAKALAGHVLRDWKDVYTVDGKEVPFDVEIAKTAIMANEDLRDFILDTASDIANFRKEVKKDVVKK